MDSSLETEGGIATADRESPPEEQLPHCTSTPFVHAADINHHQQQQQPTASFIDPMESELPVQDSVGMSNTMMNTSITALKGSSDEGDGGVSLDELDDIETPEVSNNPMNKAFCSDSSTASKLQEEECSISDGPGVPQPSSTDCDEALCSDSNTVSKLQEEECSIDAPSVPQPNSADCDNSEVQAMQDEGQSTSEETKPHNTTDSIYLSDGETTSKPPPPPAPTNKRLTMAQRAAMEALASFGGSDLASVTTKNRDLRSELKRDAEQMKGGENQTTETDGGEPPPAKKPRTRLQKAQQEVLAMFKDIPFGETSTRTRKKKKGGVTQRTSTARSRTTRAQRAREEALATFGGESLESISKKKDQPPAAGQPAAQPARRMTRVERARLEALQAFGGSGFGDVMGGAKKRVARTLEKKVESEDLEEEAVKGDGVEGEAVKSDGMEGEAVKSDGVEGEVVKSDGVEGEAVKGERVGFEEKENKDNVAVM